MKRHLVPVFWFSVLVSSLLIWIALGRSKTLAIVAQVTDISVERSKDSWTLVYSLDNGEKRRISHIENLVVGAK